MENRKFLTKRRLKIALSLYVFFPIWISCLLGPCQEGQWVFFRGAEITGRVIDEETKKPIEDVIVIASWSTRPIFGADPIGMLIILSPLYWIVDAALDLPRYIGSGKTIVAATDTDGRYKTPWWWSLQPWTYLFTGSTIPNLCIYKPGYKTIYTGYKGIWMMNDKVFSAYPENQPLTKSLTAKEIEEDFEIFRREAFCCIPANSDWLKIASILETELINIPPAGRIKIEKYLKIRHDVRSGGDK